MEISLHLGPSVWLALGRAPVFVESTVFRRCWFTRRLPNAGRSVDLRYSSVCRQRCARLLICRRGSFSNFRRLGHINKGYPKNLRYYHHLTSLNRDNMLGNTFGMFVELGGNECGRGSKTRCRVCQHIKERAQLTAVLMRL